MGSRTACAILLALVLVPIVQSDYGWNQNLYPEWGRRNVSHDLIVGRLGYGDRLLYHSFVNVHRSIFQKTDRNISYPSHGSSPFHITYIKVLDMKKDSTGGYPSIRRGGVGYYFTTIQLASQRSHGLHFNISIYGR